MYKILFSRKLTRRDHLKILKSLLIFINVTTFLMYLFLRILFYNTPISLNDDVIALAKTFLIGSLSAIGISVILIVIELVDHIIAERKLSLYPALKYTGVALFTLLIFYLAGCKSQRHGSVHKDMNTGKLTSYQTWNLKTA